MTANTTGTDPEEDAATSADLIPRAARGHVLSEGEQIYFETFGVRGNEAVVFSHGLSGNHVIWHQQIRAFARHYYVITWDQRGFGRSTARTRQLGPLPAVKDLREILDHLEIDRAHLIGQSMGGWASIGLAVQDPDRVRSIVMADTIGGIYTPEIRQHYGDVVARNASGTARPAYEELAIGQHPAIGAKFRRENPIGAFLYEQIGDPSRELVQAIRDLLIATEFSQVQLQKLDMPMLFIVGAQDEFFPPKLIRAAAARVSASRVVEIADTGHSPYFEAPEEWNRVVLDFLTEVSG